MPEAMNVDHADDPQRETSAIIFSPEEMQQLAGHPERLREMLTPEQLAAISPEKLREFERLVSQMPARDTSVSGERPLRSADASDRTSEGTDRTSEGTVSGSANTSPADTSPGNTRAADAVPETVARVAAEKQLGALVDVPQGPLSQYGLPAPPVSAGVVAIGGGLILVGLFLAILSFARSDWRPALIFGLLIGAGGVYTVVETARTSGWSIFRYQNGFVRAKEGTATAYTWADVATVDDRLITVKQSSGPIVGYRYRSTITLAAGGKVTLHAYHQNRETLEARAQGLMQLSHQAKSMAATRR